jgi:hypothetical protein
MIRLTIASLLALSTVACAQQPPQRIYVPSPPITIYVPIPTKPELTKRQKARVKRDTGDKLGGIEQDVQSSLNSAPKPPQ